MEIYYVHHQFRMSCKIQWFLAGHDSIGKAVEVIFRLHPVDLGIGNRNNEHLRGSRPWSISLPSCQDLGQDRLSVKNRENPKIPGFLGDFHGLTPRITAIKVFSLQPLPGCLERSIRHAPHPKCQSGPGAAGRSPTALRVLGEYHRSKQEMFQPMFDCRGWRDANDAWSVPNSQLMGW